MNKRSLPVLLLIIFALQVFGKKVDQQQAAVVARNFFCERASIGQKAPMDNITVDAVYTRVEEGQTVYYVFNVNDQGYVIVSGDDVVKPVIGYSFEGTYSNENLPVQMTEWMNNISDQVLYHSKRQSQRPPHIQSEWEHLGTADVTSLVSYKGVKSVDPLLVTTWDQGAYYNELCPQDPDGPAGRVWAGCVATAMAQVMFYYRFPAHGAGNHGYMSDYGYLSANFGNTTYQWDEMLTSIHSSNLAIATLLYHCGIAVNMGYSPGGSGAYSGTAANALISYFKYSPETHMEDKDNYSDDDWANLLRNQLDSKMPMYYHGFGSGGHAFNVDGYQPGDYFHFNWGWSGSYNGYFYLNNLNPGSYSFTSGQGAMINIYPTGEYPSYCSGSKTFTGQAGTVDDGSASLFYQGNTDCYYLINPQASPDDSINYIKLKFNFLDTESGHDSLVIYDGPTTSSPILGSFSGNTLPGLLTSTSNKILLHFTSDASNHGNGFLLTYESVFPDYCDGIDIHTDASGTIADGSGNKHYNNKTVCQYLIQPHTTGNVTLVFSQFKTEASNDFLEVYAYDTLTQQGTLLGHFSGSQLPPAVTSTTGALFLIFFTNGSINDDGWQASYYVTPVGIADNEERQVVSLYPNPASQVINLVICRSEAAPITMEIVNLTGQTVVKEDLGIISGSCTKSIPVDQMGKGSYFVRLISPTGISVNKLMVE
jgi:hypothetical protein